MDDKTKGDITRWLEDTYDSAEIVNGDLVLTKNDEILKIGKSGLVNKSSEFLDISIYHSFFKVNKQVPV